MSLIDSTHTNLLEKMMDVYTLRNKITAANVANIDTPGYNKASVKFEEQLAQKLESGQISSGAVKNMNPSIEVGDQKPILEDELMEMADTQIRVQLATRALRHNFDQIRSGISGRTG
ncbi:MAG: flagellar basal body protein [Balneolales bacterium]